MAVQAQYPPNVLLSNRNLQDTNNYSFQPQHGGAGFVEQSHILCDNNGVGCSPRKRSRKDAATPRRTTANSFNLSVNNQQQQLQQNQSYQLIDLTHQQNHQQPNVVSTGLRLSFGGDQNHQLQQPNKNLSLFSDDFSLLFKQQTDELTHFLHSQAEHLKRTLADKTTRHYRALLGVAEEAAARRIREKQVEVEKVARRNAELEARAGQLSADIQAWQAQAQFNEAQVANLQAQLRQVMVGPTYINGGDGEGSGVGSTGIAEDAESVNVEPVSDRRVMSPSCKMCRTRVASVLLLPCRHLCVCRECDDVVQACPICMSFRTAGVEVYLT
ncbi:unnamed protein product [Amaranthus hypochondriacus]